MNYEINYSNTKHGYVRLLPDMTLKLTIPLNRQKDKNFERALLEKWETLISRYKKRNITKLETIVDNCVMIFWEKIPLDTISGNLDNYLKEKLQEVSLPILDKYTSLIWIRSNDFKIKNLKSKWWSCSGTNNINLNLKLVHLPQEILEYVIIHEVCHLKEKNHWQRFWKLVEKYCENYKEVRKELKNIRIWN